MSSLETDLRVTRDRLQATIEELESTNEELKSSNEEYQSINEELQSANEEMETSKEELQSVNEELQTVNGELGHRVSELGRTNSDLKNLLEATQIATVFLDNDLRVRNFTPAATDIFHLLDTDVGRPLDHVVSRVAYPELQDDVRRVLKTLVSVERQVSDPAAERHFTARVLPYRSVDNYISGAVVTFMDLTVAYKAEAALRLSEQRLRLALTVGGLASWDWNMLTGVINWSEAHYKMEGYEVGEVVPTYEAWIARVHPEDRAAAEKSLSTARDNRIDYEHRFRSLHPDGTLRFLYARGIFFYDADGQPVRMIGIMEDVTDARTAEERLRASEEQFRQFGEASSDVLWLRDAETLQWVYLTPAFETIYGLDREQATSGNDLRNWAELILPEDREHAIGEIRRVRKGERAAFEYRVRRPVDGQIRWLRNTDFPIFDADGTVRQIGGIGRDITDERATAKRMEVLVAELQHRTRNLIAVVRSMADKTLRSSGDLSDFRSRFREGLDALARVQGLLSRLKEGDRVTFDELIHTELAAHGVTEGHYGSTIVEGPADVRLRSTTVQTLAMALHELATNAVKYGALGQSSGQLTITWSLEPSGPGNKPWLHIDWRETGIVMQPPGSAPRGSGQGRELIEQALPYQLDAKTSYKLLPDGVHCTISVPVSATTLEGNEHESSDPA